MDRWVRRILCGIYVLLAVGQTTPAATGSEIPLFDVSSYRDVRANDYSRLESADTGGWTIPGLATGFVPQGIASIPESGMMLLSGYQGLSYSGIWRWRRVDDKRSMVMLVEQDSGRPVRIGFLTHRTGRAMDLHAGGVAIHGNHFWIPARNRAYRFSLSALLDADQDIVELNPDAAPIAVDSRGSFVSIWEDYLLIGDFFRPRSHPVPGHRRSPHADTGHQAWTLAFRLDGETGLPATGESYRLASDPDGTAFLRPDFIMHHRRRVQGIAIRDDGWVALSVSYGPRDSSLAFYRLGPRFDPSDAPDRTQIETYGGVVLNIPSWTLARDLNWQDSLPAPPGSEGVTWLDDVLAVVFEGGAYPYRERWGVIEDRVRFVRRP